MAPQPIAVTGATGFVGGRVARLLAEKKTHEDIVAELYLATLSRLPGAAEQEACRRLLAEAPDPKTFYEDLLWSLINSKQFLFVR
jgi:nucleoside-diphosphate-sugar epimerase